MSRYTQRDQQIVAWIGALGAAGAEHVTVHFSIGRSVAYARLGSLQRGGLLERRTLLHAEPGLYVATRAGLRWCGLERLGPFRLSVAGFAHAREVATVAARLHGLLAGWEILGERELRLAEALAGRLIGSVNVGELPDGRPAVHRPDLLLAGPAGRTVALEVELSIKGRGRLLAICRAYGRARHIGSVYYLAAPAPGRAVKRVVAELRAQDRITVLELEAIERLAASEREEQADGSAAADARR